MRAMRSRGRQQATAIELERGVERVEALELARDLVAQALALAPGGRDRVDVAGDHAGEFEQLLDVAAIADLEQVFELVEQPVLAYFEPVAIRAVGDVDGIILVLVEAEIAQHEVGHRLAEIAEEKHLALQVLLAAEQAEQVVAGLQPGEEFTIVTTDQGRLELVAAQLAEHRGAIGAGQQFGLGVQR